MKLHLIRVITTGCLLGLSVIPLTALATAQVGVSGESSLMGKPYRFNSGELPPHLRNLNLSAEQRAKIIEILKTRGPALQEKAKAGWSAYNDLNKLAFSTDYSPQQAKALSDTAVRLMAEASLLHADMENAIYQLLTPEQQQQLKP